MWEPGYTESIMSLITPWNSGGCSRIECREMSRSSTTVSRRSVFVRNERTRGSAVNVRRQTGCRQDLETGKLHGLGEVEADPLAQAGP